MAIDTKFLYKIPDSNSENRYYQEPNIINASAKIFKKMIEYEEIVCCAEMQSGKTDVMKRLIEVVKCYGSKLSGLNINIDKGKIYVILCTSSKDLKSQLKIKLPEIQNHIYHLNDIQKFLKNPYEYDSLLMDMTDDGLLIFDECHCDAEQKKTIDRFRQRLEIFSKEYANTYYRIGFSATPYEQIISKFPKVIMTPNVGYYGLRQMIERKTPVMFQAKDLSNETDCSDLFDEINLTSAYYIIRLPGRKDTSDIAMKNIEKTLDTFRVNFDSVIYDMYHQTNINDILKKKPTKLTIVYIKDKLRMGEYLNTEHVYMVHDDSENSFTHTTAQSLLGRCCGYGKKNHSTLIYCDFDKAVQHYEWIINNYRKKYIPNDSKYIGKNGLTKNICIY